MRLRSTWLSKDYAGCILCFVVHETCTCARVDSANCALSIAMIAPGPRGTIIQRPAAYNEASETNDEEGARTSYARYVSNAMAFCFESIITNLNRLHNTCSLTSICNDWKNSSNRRHHSSSPKFGRYALGFKNASLNSISNPHSLCLGDSHRLSCPIKPTNNQYHNSLSQWHRRHELLPNNDLL